MDEEKIRKCTGIVLATLIAVLSFTSPMRSLYSVPEHLRLTEGQATVFQIKLPMKVFVESGKKGIIRLNGNEITNQTLQVSGQKPISIQSMAKGQVKLNFKLLGVIPIHRMVVEVVPEVKVVPGGQSIGVLLYSQGAIVVGHAPILQEDGVKSYPAKEAGIAAGDLILEVNGNPVKSEENVAEIINEVSERGDLVKLKIERNGKIYTCKIKAAYCRETKRYRIGLYIRDNISGVGTLTFYDPKSNKYGALGHMITDADTNKQIKVREGKIVNATISTVRASQKSFPGEKIGIFETDSEVVGNIEKNTEFGIFGNINANALPSEDIHPIPIALADQVKEGPATILTVIEGDKVEAFSVEIEKVFLQRALTTKSLIIKITDKRLIEKTGGIVQGMSGSPIIQDGKIVGAVTHVFINDPLHGYGVLAERMYYECIKDNYVEKDTKGASVQAPLNVVISYIGIYYK